MLRIQYSHIHIPGVGLLMPGRTGVEAESGETPNGSFDWPLICVTPIFDFFFSCGIFYNLSTISLVYHCDTLSALP